MIRPITKEDRDIYVSLADLFYHSEAVDHPVPPAYYERTFEELLRSKDYLEGFLFEVDREPAGYVLLAKTFSQEAGGMVWWIEELFLLPKFRGHGLGRQFFKWLEDYRPKEVKRLRLEVERDNLRAKRLYGRQGYEVLPYEQMIKPFQ